MATNIRSFRPVKSIDFGTSSDIAAQAGRQLESGANTLSRVLGQVKERNIAQDTALTKTNDQAIQSSLDRIKSLGEFNQAESEGKFLDESLAGQFGDKYNKDSFKTGLARAKERLSSNAVSTAFGIAENAAKGTRDITQGRAAMRQSLLDSGMNVQEVDKTTSAWASSTGLSDQFKREDTNALNSALDKFNSALGEDMSTTEALSLAGVGLKAENLRKFTKEAKQVAIDKASFTPEQNAEVTKLANDNQFALDQVVRQGTAQINTAKTQLGRMPEAISQETANEFANVTNHGSHVLEKFAGLIRNPASAGMLNATFNMFNDVTTGDAALDIVNERYQLLIAPGPNQLSEKDAAAVILESWKNGLSAHESNLGAPGVAKEAFETAIKNKTITLNNRRKLESQIGSAEAELENQRLTLGKRNADDIYNFKKQIRTGNKTGKAAGKFKRAVPPTKSVVSDEPETTEAVPDRLTQKETTQKNALRDSAVKQRAARNKKRTNAIRKLFREEKGLFSKNPQSFEDFKSGFSEDNITTAKKKKLLEALK